MPDSNLVKGVYFKTPHENAPDFVKRKVGVNVDQFIEYLQEHRNKDGYVNFDLKEAKSLHWYLQLDTYPLDNSGESKPTAKTLFGAPPPKFGVEKLPEDFNDDIPF